jgi:hypothetical protein
MTRQRLFALLAALCAGGSCMAADITCPASLPAPPLPDAAKLALDAPWEALSRGYAPSLISAVVYTGHPREGGIERPQTHRPGARQADGFAATDYIYDLKEYQPPWLECMYTNTDVVLVRPLTGATTCVSTLAPRRRNGPSEFVSMVCR